MHDSITEQSDQASHLPWPFVAAFIPFWYAWVAWSWWSEIRTQIEHAGLDEPALAAMGGAAMAATGLLGRLGGALTEAGVYTLWWRSRGARLPYWRFFAWVVALSVGDLLGFALRRVAADADGIMPILAHVLAGPAAVDVAATSGLGAAFGSLGVLTLLRVAMTAWAQARGVGRPLMQPMVLTVAAWLLTRLVTWWSFDLLRGLSPVR